MTPEQIRKKADKVRQRLKEHDGKRKIIEAELLALQHACPHVNSDGRNVGDYSGGSSYDWSCKDCGKYTST